MIAIVKEIAKRFGNAALRIGFAAYRDFEDARPQLEVDYWLST